MTAPTRRKGKKSIVWYNDPEILLRLASVGALIHQGARAGDIAAAMGTSIDTARRDIKRVREWWQREAAQSLTDIRNETIDNYRYMMTEAWQRYNNSKNDRDRRDWLRVVMDCQKQIDDVTGVRRETGDNLQGNVKLTLTWGD